MSNPIPPSVISRPGIVTRRLVHEPRLTAWWKAFRSPRGAVTAGIILTYVWRFHDFYRELAVLRLAAICTVLSWAFLLLEPRWPVLKRALRHPAMWAFLIWSGWLGIGAITSPFPAAARSSWTGVHLTMITMMLFLLGFLVSVRNLHAVVVTHVVSAGIVSLYWARGGFSRFWSPMAMYDPNDTALLLVMVAPLAVYLAMTAERGWPSRALWFLAVAVAASGIASQSRGAFLGLAAAIGFMMLRASELPLKVKVGIPTLLIVGLIFAPAEVRDRLATLQNLEADYNTQTETGRLETWTRGLSYVSERPLMGFGILNFWRVDATLAPQRAVDPDWRGKAAHNSLLQVLVESGIVGLAFFLFMIGSACYRLLNVKRRLRGVPGIEAKRLKVLSESLVACFVAYLVGGFFLSQGYQILMFSLVALAVGVDLCARRLRARLA